VERIVRPFQDFAHKQSSGGILLIAVTVVALVWANSPGLRITPRCGTRS
jgi:Na+:H+ antiporter, NhaA family